MRDSKGKFLVGSTGGPGRPPEPGKQLVKDMAWASINKVAWLIFNLPKKEMELWIASNRHTLSLAEEAYLEEATGGLGDVIDETGMTRKRANLNVIEAILDRIIGKTLKLDSGPTERDPVIERLYQLSPGNVRSELDRLIKNREVILAERKQIEAAKNRRTDEQG